MGAYTPLRIGAAASTLVTSFIQEHMELTLRDVHDMLRLPLPKLGINSALNYSVVHVLLNEIGGIATVFFDASGTNRNKYVGLLSNYYPWDVEACIEDSVVGSDAANILYEFVRNPFSHSLGIGTKQLGPRENRRVVRTFGSDFKVNIVRVTSLDGGGLSPSLLAELEGVSRPTWILSTVNRDGEPNEYSISVEALYRGVRLMLERLTRSEAAMRHAKNFLDASSEENLRKS